MGAIPSTLMRHCPIIYIEVLLERYKETVEDLLDLAVGMMPWGVNLIKVHITSSTTPTRNPKKKGDKVYL